MLDYNPQGLVLRSGKAGVRLVKLFRDGLFTLQRHLQSGNEDEDVQISTMPFYFSDLGEFSWLPGPLWQKRASERELSQPDGHLDHVLKQALEQGFITLSCSVDSDSGYLVFSAQIGKGSARVWGRAEIQRVTPFLAVSTSTSG